MIRRIGWYGFLALTMIWMSSPALCGEEWKEVSKEVRASKPDVKGWVKDEAAKCFVDASGEILKLQTGELGAFIIELKNQKVYRLEGDERVEISVKKLMQRNGGNMLVLRSDTVKARVSFRTRVPAVHKYLPGITRSM